MSLVRMLGRPCVRNILTSGRISTCGLRQCKPFQSQKHVKYSTTNGGDTQSNSGSGGVPSGAEVVVCGGGVVGTSVAYHLAERGVKDVVLLEQGSLGGGTTWHSAALVLTLREHPTLAAVTAYGAELYKKLEEQGYGTGFKQCGSLHMGRTKSRMSAYKRMLSSVRPFGREAEVISPQKISELVPWVRTDDLEGAVYLPHDGVVSSTDLANSFAKRAKEQGVRVLEKCEVERVFTDGRRVTGVQSGLGTIDCKHFVNASGMWAKDLGQKSDPVVSVPKQPCEHFYIVTKPLDGVDLMTPSIRDYDGYIYFREWSGGLLAGGFEPKAKPCFRDGTPRHFEFQLLQEDWDQFQILWDEIVHRVPMMENAEIRQLINGPESFTPDSGYLFGPAPEIENYWLACGMSSIGIVSSGGVGRAVAEWITEGKTSLDFSDFDVRRYGKIHMNPDFLANRASEILGIYGAAIPSTEVDYQEGRNLRLSPLHDQLQAAGAYFTTAMGWERVAYMKTGQGQAQGQGDRSAEVKDAFGPPSWLGCMEQEVNACKTGTGLFDASSLVVLDVMSDDGSALELLEKLCFSDLDVDDSTVVETGMLNDKGGYEALCSVLRNSGKHFTILATPEQETRLNSWINRHLPPGGAVTVEDRTGRNTILQLLGPKSQSLIDEFLSRGLTVIKQSSFYSNHLVFIAEQEEAVSVFQTLKAKPEVTLIGYDATRFHGAQYGEPTWGIDIKPYDLATVWGKWESKSSKTKNYLGKEAVERSTGGSNESLILLEVTPPGDKWLWGHEPVYADGSVTGWTTSALYDFDKSKILCWALVDGKSAEASVIEIDVANEKIAAEIRKHEIK